MSKKKTKQQLPEKRPQGERFIPLSLILIFILVLLAGGFAFIQLDKIVQSINSGIQPDKGQIITRNIINHLRYAENSVKSYSLTRNDVYLSNFYQSAKQTEADLQELAANLQPGDSVEIYYDSLQGLVEKKFTQLDQLLEIQDEYRVQQAVTKMTETIQEDSLKFLEQEEEGFFNRLFKGKKKQAEEVAARQEKIQELTQEVQEQKEEEIERERRIRSEELNLISSDREIMQQISSLLAWFDRKAIQSIEERTQTVGKNIAQIRRSIGFFVIVAALLLMISIFTIVRFVRSNRRYQKALQNARNEAENLAKSRERFLANMSHEIRTPMNIISGFTNQVLKTNIEEEQREQLHIVKNSADHLVHILNDVLDFSKLEAGKLSLNPKSFNLHELVKEIRALFLPSAKEKNIELLLEVKEDVPEIVKADPVRLRQILVNLIGNAIKFTDKGFISLKLEAGEKKGKKRNVIFRVEDTGAGIPEKDLQRIFGEFEQSGSSLKQNSPGTGLGLAITRMLTGLFTGEVKIESRVGAGTKFIVSLPLAEGNKEEIEIKKAGAFKHQLPANLNILVVDDEEYNRRLLLLMLRDHQVNLIEAVNAEEAISLLEQMQIDLILSDIRLPGMNGTEMTEVIRKMPDKSKAEVPVIALTASVTLEDRRRYKKAGMNAFLPKPVPENDLLEMIARFVPENKKVDEQITMEASEEKPVYDLSALKHLSNDSNGFFKEMLDLFIKNTTEGFAELESLIEQHNWEQAKEQAHKIVSPARHLKANKLISYLKEIEKLNINDHPEEQASESLVKAREEFRKIVEDVMLD